MRRWTTWLCCGLLVACGSDEVAPAPASTPAPAPVAPPRQQWPEPPKWSKPSEASQPFTSSAPVLPESLARAEFGMSRAAVAQLAPKLADGQDTSRNFPGVRYSVDFDGTGDGARLERVRVVLDAPQGEVLASLTEAWGPPTTGLDVETPIALWFNPDSGIRALMKLLPEREPEVELDRFMPARQLLGAPDKPLGFETIPLLGTRRESIAEEYGSPIRIPPTEFGVTPSVVETTLQDDVVVGFAFILSFRRRSQAREDLLELVGAKWGEGRKVSDTHETYEYDSGVRVTEDTTEQAWVVSIGDYDPAIHSEAWRAK